MRRFLSISFLALALMIGATGAAPVAHAGLTDAADGCPIGQVMDPFGSCMTQASLDTQNAAATVAQKAAAQTPTAINPNVDNSILAGIMIWLQSLFAWLLGVAAITLDNAVYYTVVSMGTYVSNLTAIGVTWRILRDIGNIMLIFGFLAIGISVILNTERIGYGKKMLPMLLVAAVFLNFSLFFAEAVIDTGNLFATQFYTQINGGTAAGAKNFDLTSVSNEGISNKIMSQLGLATIYSAALTNNSVYKGTNVSAISFMSIILFIVAAFVMFSLAFILIARFVMLIFLIILAPVGFAGLAVPQLKGQADKWWGALFEQTITAPILLLLLYVALAVITDAHFLGFGPSADWSGFVPKDNGSTNFTGFASMMLSFLVAMGLLLAVTISAKKLSAFGASKATAYAGKLTFGATALAGRSTVGWGAQRASERWRNSKLGRTAVIGRLGAGILDRGAKASFDVRGAPIGGGLKGIGIDAGTAQKGGYQASEKAAIKGREDYAKTLGQTKGEKVEQKVEEGRKKMMETTVEIIGKQNKSEMEGLQEKHKNELMQNTNEVERIQKDLTKMKSDQKMGASITDAEITEAQNALIAAQTVRKQKEATQRREQDELSEAHKKTIDVQKADVVAHQETIDKLKRAGQEGYAAGITWGPGQFFNKNTKAAETIRKEAKKGKSEKDLEKIKKFLEDSDKPKEENKSEEKKPTGAH